MTLGIALHIDVDRWWLPLHMDSQLPTTINVEAYFVTEAEVSRVKLARGPSYMHLCLCVRDESRAGQGASS